MPVAACIGGKVQKFDYVNVTHMNRQNLELFAEKCRVSGEGIRFYIIKNGGFKLLFSDEDILEEALDHMKAREFTVYIEHTPPQPNEVAVETGTMRGKKGQTKAKGKGKKKGKGKVMDKEKGKTKVVEDDDIVFLGVVGGRNDMNAETGGLEDDEINNETETGGVGIFEENVEFLDNENDIGIASGSNDAEEDNSENTSIDMMASENDLNEHRQSDDEKKWPNFVAFNPDQMYDPALELGMIFSSKKEFKKAVQSHAIKSKRTVKFTKNDSFRVYAVFIKIQIGDSRVNDQPPILPPIVEQNESMYHDVEPEILTEPGPTSTPPCVQGPTMYEQLQVANTNISFQPQVTLQSRLNIRAPSPMTGTSFMPSFSSRPSDPISKTIVKEHGRKGVDISKWPSQSSEDHGKK
ncbi:UNVERIFIED_CONTAM: hypothetical protein Sindi_0492700 [Sesamum indicum]